MRYIFTVLALVFMSAPLLANNETDTLVWRIKSMRCEDCAHKVSTALRKDKGVQALSFNLERRTVDVAYDAAKTCPDSIMQRLRGTRYKPSAYNPQDTITRGMGLQVADMHCQRCADRIMQRLSGMTGIDSVAPNVEKHYVFVRYDANRTSKATIRDVLGSMGFTPVNYYTSKNISFAYFLIPAEAATDDTIETALAIDGVDDANVNRQKHALAITYVNTETSEERLLQALNEEGVKATLPTPHKCSEQGRHGPTRASASSPVRRRPAASISSPTPRATWASSATRPTPR